MAKRWLAGLFLILTLVLASVMAPRVAAQNAEPGEHPEIIIEWPNEGETLYAAPSSLEYSIPLKGRIAGLPSAGEEVTVEMTVLRDGQIVGQYAQVTLEHSFTYLASVNPHHSEQLFPAEHLACADDCHRPGAFALPAGALTVRVAITEPARLANTVAERNFFVDHSATVTIPVELQLEGNPEQPVAGVTVSGATWLYLWRSRQFLGASDSGGTAQLSVEALGMAPTEYLLRVEPTVVDGVLYEGIDEARVELAPGTTTGPAVTLHVRARMGRIEGQVGNFDLAADCHAHAIALPDGRTYTTDVSPSGAFVFADLPIDQYRVVLDSAELANQRQASIWEDVNLTAAIDESVSLPLAATPHLVFHGRITDEGGAILPFGWVEMGEKAGAVTPADGQYAVTGERETASLVVQAPGFYSEARSVDGQDSETDVVLRPLKGTQELAWGEGSIWLPADSKVELDGKVIRLERGWIWGAGESSTSYHVTTGRAEITVAAGRFALEYLPENRGWLYVFAGEAELQDRRSGESLAVAAGEMVNLFNDEGLKAVPYDPLVHRTLNGSGAAPMAPQWEPSLSALIRNRVGVVGIGAAQLITFVTYFLVLLSLGATPLILLYLHYRRGRSAAGDAKIQP
jgi:hypothetical protein